MNFPYLKDTFETSNCTPIYNTTRELAANYIEFGFGVTPVKFRGKKPIIPGWRKHPIGTEDVDSWFGREPTNIGVLLLPLPGGLWTSTSMTMTLCNSPQLFCPTRKWCSAEPPTKLSPALSRARPW